MSVTNTGASKNVKRPKRRKPWPQLAQQHGVSTRTLDRWAERGIISPPIRINERKYGLADETPRLDVTKPRARSDRDAETGLLKSTT